MSKSESNMMVNSLTGSKLVVAGTLILLLASCRPTPADQAGQPAGADNQTTNKPAELRSEPKQPATQVPTQIFDHVETALVEGVDPGVGTFVFYLHGGIVEGSDGRPTHPQRGTYEYQQIVDAMADTGVIVISEVRPLRTDVGAYADLVVKQIQTLLKAGVTPDRVAVIGFSKGGNIALQISHRLGHDEVAFVIIGACGDWLRDTRLDLQGRMLSVYEASDRIGKSCREVVARSQTEPFFHEIETQMGKGHGSFFEPSEAWMLETMLWCNAPGLQRQMAAPERIDVDS